MNRDYRPHILIAVSFFALWLSGCTTRVHGYAYADVPEVYYEQPEFVAVAPDVWVVSNHHTTVYYHAGCYWHLDGGAWTQTSTWGGARVSVHTLAVPGVIAHRQHHVYAGYRGHAQAERHHRPARPATHHRPQARHNRADRAPNRPHAPAMHRGKAKERRPAARKQRPVLWKQRPAMKERRPAAGKRRPATNPRRPSSPMTRPTVRHRTDKKPKRQPKRDHKKKNQDRPRRR